MPLKLTIITTFKVRKYLSVKALALKSVTIDWFLYDTSFSEKYLRTDFKAAFVFTT